MAKFIIFGSDGRREIDLTAHNPLGRHPQNRIQVLDRLVSKEHSVILFEKGRGWILRDLGSLNGTQINKQRVEGEQPLADGDEVTLGTTRCMFLSEEVPKAVAGKVDVSDDALESHIRSKIAQVEDRFLHETEIGDTKAVRADYEKLRMTYELQRDIGEGQTQEHIGIVAGDDLERLIKDIELGHSDRLPSHWPKVFALWPLGQSPWN